MAISLTHTTQATGTDAGNGDIRKAQWNEAHTLTMAADFILGRATAGNGVVEEIPCTAFGRSLIGDASASEARTTLNVDTAGTDNSTPVTLAGTGTYLSITGQQITVDPITESDIADLQNYATLTGTETLTNKTLTNPTCTTMNGDVGASDANLEFGGGRSADGNALIDFHATTGADFDCRFERLAGTNGSGGFNHKGTGNFNFRLQGAADFQIFTSNTIRCAFASGGAVRFHSIGTTGSAANAFLDSGSNNNLLRSTSRSIFKENIEPIDPAITRKVLAAVPRYWRSKLPADEDEIDGKKVKKSFYGFLAEEIAEIDPRLATWGYTDDDYEEVEDYRFTPVKREMVDGQWQDVPGKEEVYYKRQLKQGAVKIPDGVAYDRLVAFLVDGLKVLDARVTELEAQSGLPAAGAVRK